MKRAKLTLNLKTGQCKRAETTATTHTHPTAPRLTFLQRLTPAIKSQVPARLALVRKSAVRNERTTSTVGKHLRHFRDDAPAMLAAMSLTLRPSTTRTYAAALMKIRPEHKELATLFKRRATVEMLTAGGKPTGAAVFTAAAMGNALRRTSEGPLKNALILLFISASRVIDLRHFHVDQTPRTVWRIAMVPRLELDGALIPPKNDQSATLHLIKWLPKSPHYCPRRRPWPSPKDIANWTRQHLNTTPHAIRRSATQYLERQGFTGPQIATLTGHTSTTDSNPGLAPYTARLQWDPGARMCLQMSTLLLESLSL